jgi:hypothetical protein
MIVSYYFHLGEIDKGFEWLKRAYTVKEDLSDIKYEPDYDEVRADPRYLDPLKRLGLE